MKKVSKPKRDFLKLLSLVTALLMVCSTNQAASRKVCEFYLTKEAKHSRQVDKKQMKNSQVDQQITKKSLIGKLSSTWSPKESKMVVSITYPPEEGQSRKPNKKLSVSFPFKDSPEYLKKSITYSTKSKNQTFRISKQDISQNQTDHQNNLLDISSASNSHRLSLFNITTKIVFKGKTASSGLESSQPQIKGLRFSFEDDRFIYHFELIDILIEMHDLKIDWVFFTALFFILISPCWSFWTFIQFDLYFLDKERSWDVFWE